jgi:hypothetical protein
MLSITLGRAKFNSERIGVPLAALAKVVEVSASKLSDAFRDVGGKLSPTKEAEIDTVVTRLANFHAAFAPLSLPKNWEALRELVVSPVTPEEVQSLMSRIFISKDSA